MARDKQLLTVELAQVIEKRRLDQALNAKEFAVLAGISYSAARAWFRRPGFPVCCGVVFWQDFVQWRGAQAGLRSVNQTVLKNQDDDLQAVPKKGANLPVRAAQILAQAG
jgi:hypothetical protein